MARPAPPDGISTRLPAASWEEALVTGNGRQGALVHAVQTQVRLTLGHERLFWPLEEPLPAPHTAPALAELRALLRSGRPRAAAERVVELARAEHPGYARTRWIDPLTGAGTLTFTPARPGWGSLARHCEYATAVVREELPGGLVHEVFASRADDVVALRLRAPGGVDGVLALGPLPGEPPTPADTVLTSGPHTLALRVAFTRPRPNTPTGYVLTCRVCAPGGRVSVDGPGRLRVRGAPEVVVLARTTLSRTGGAPEADAALEELEPDFTALLERHVPRHADLVSRARVRLTPRGRADSAPVWGEELLAAGPRPELVERLVDAGHYAIVCATGELPPTLQGVWSGAHSPPWSSGYTLDGNLASAVAALYPLGAAELMLPVFDLLDSLRGDFADNARRLYGCRGLLVPAHVSTHGRHNHFGPEWCLTLWTAGAAWLARLYWDHYSHTRDVAFLRERALPFLRAAAEFHEDFVSDDGFVPSYSPENTPADSDSQACVNATMDVAAVRDLLRNLLRAHRVLGLPGARRWAALAARLPGYRVSPAGELAEWASAAGPLEQADHHAHRHASHLFPFWYEGDPAFADPALRASAVRAVRARLAWWRSSDADEMAFGLVQLGLAAAHLGLADEAHQALRLMATRYWRPTLVSTHNRGALFNTDICGGFAAVVAAMLLRSREGRVDLLPALPAPWTEGEAHGLCARGGVVVDRLEWEGGRMRAEVGARASVRVRVGLPDGTVRRLDLVPGRTETVEAALAPRR
ncbi:glycoside hydrolase N-terminal domain-containing protein [Thermobifida halotolerans]|uniref:Glycoside hydrolase N-terminal domain-containing protein n=1 Tax=Thermobifida halotolerans TaxID=483545 RepID=A0AA97M554_9ACTN|nr:glycoside hydrolase N-terminal domain-containing protein [Thermobifida halotolerans]UOE20813.1 glycoside hydrolase N-terminal domain-containing protein [Thermobifida halotolerans]